MSRRGSGVPVRCAIAMLLVILPFAGAVRSATAQSDEPPGRIAYARNGDIWEWSDGDQNLLVEDGAATDPSWSPGADEIAFVRTGGSFADLCVYNFADERTYVLTDSESNEEPGSADYVVDSTWLIDPEWSASGIIVFGSDRGSTNGLIELWIMDGDTGDAYRAASDGGDQGSIEHVTVNDDGDLAAYTVLASGGETGGTTYVALRDLDTGETIPIAEGVRGAYDPTISPDSAFLVVSIRDESGISDLWVIDLETGVASRLTDGLNATSAVWSRDGEWIAFIKPDGRIFEIWALPVDPDTVEVEGDPVRLVREDDLDATGGLTWTDADGD